MKRHAEIAGAGFAGLVAATALARRGWTVQVHERSSELRAFGAGIFIWENGLRVLQAIGAYDEVMRRSHQGAIYETRDGERLVAQTPFSPERGSRMVTLTRQDLYDAILAQARRAGVEFRTGSEIVAADPQGELRARDGARFRCDLAVGADGVASNVCKSLGIGIRRQPCADGIARVLAPRCLEELGPGNWDHVIDFWQEGGRGLRILYVPCNREDLYLAMMAPVNDPEATAMPLKEDRWCAAIPQLEPVIRRIRAGGRYDPYETRRVEHWSVGRVALIGDAAHAMVPTLGQGAGCAMMNGLSLAAAVAEAADVAQALAGWEARERPLTDYTQDQSEQAAIARLMASGTAWNDQTLRTARHVPTGTAHLGPH